MNAVRICDAFGWTYEQYLEQPTWFIELLIRKRAADAVHEEKQQGKLKR